MINYAAVDYSYLTAEIEDGDSKQLRVMKKLSAHLAAIPGFEGMVFRGKGTITTKEVEDCLSLLEAPRSLFGEAAGNGGLRRSEQWALLLQGWPKDDPLNPSDPAYALKAKVEFQLAQIVHDDDRYGRKREDDLYKLGGDIASLDIGQGIVRPVSSDHGNSRLAEFFIPLLVEIQTDKLNPSK